MFFGIVSILAGMPPTLMTMAAILACVRLAADGGPAFVYVFVGMFGLLNAVAATFSIWAGIDSIRCRRWVRPVIIALAWPALLTLLLMIAGLVLCAMTYVPPGPTAGSGDRQAILFVAVLYTMVAAVPGAFLIFYTRGAVRETLAASDPSPSWAEASRPFCCWRVMMLATSETASDP